MLCENQAGVTVHSLPSAPLIAALAANGRLCSLRDWEQIENEAEVHRILRQIESSTRFNVYQRADLYECVYPGYPGDREFYLRQGSVGRVLYLGTGTGRIFGPMARQNRDAIGIDNSAEMMAVLRERFADLPDHQLLLGDASRIDLPAAHFDIVLAPYSFLQVVPPHLSHARTERGRAIPPFSEISEKS